MIDTGRASALLSEYGRTEYGPIGADDMAFYCTGNRPSVAGPDSYENRARFCATCGNEENPSTDVLSELDRNGDCGHCALDRHKG